MISYIEYIFLLIFNYLINVYIYFSKIQPAKQYTKEDEIQVEKIVEEEKVFEEQEEERQQWSNPVEFLLSCIAMSVGLGSK